MNTFGNNFRLTDFGESHGPAIGGVIDGMPSGFSIDFLAVDEELALRRPGQAAFVSSRREPDKVEWLSGIFDGRTLGTPIAFIIRNTDARSGDYENLADAYRPNHADYTYQVKYGIRDYRGGGRASARETAVRVVAGALARQVLNQKGITVCAWTSRIGSVTFDGSAVNRDAIYSSEVRCPDFHISAQMIQVLEEARKNRDTLGGIVSCRICGVPAGVGEPVFGKLQARLASAMMSINAAKGFDYGDGFEAAAMNGSDSLDIFVADGGKVRTLTNHSGGIQGGISNGNDITFRVAFKPIATMPRPLHTITSPGAATTVEVHGRHDICAVPRAVPVVEAMAAITILDAILD